MSADKKRDSKQPEELQPPEHQTQTQQEQENVAEGDGQSQSATSYLDQNANTCKEKEAEIKYPVVTPADMELLRHLVVADLASAVKTMAEFIGRPRN